MPLRAHILNAAFAGIIGATGIGETPVRSPPCSTSAPCGALIEEHNGWRLYRAEDSVVTGWQAVRELRRIRRLPPFHTDSGDLSTHSPVIESPFWIAVNQYRAEL